MIFLACEWAIFQRLVGWPVDSHGKPKVNSTTNRPDNSLLIGPPETNGARLPSYGVRIPMLKAPYDTSHPLSSKTPDAVRLFDKGMDAAASRQIPVFFEGIDGRQWESIWPCVTFRLSDMDQRKNTYIYFDSFETGVGEDVEIENKAGETVQEGSPDAVIRPHPESWDLEYTFTVYSKNSVEFGLIIECLTRLFPQRGAIEIEQMDGTKIVLDMLLTTTVDVSQKKSDKTFTLLGDQTEYYARAFTYRIEAYADNTANKFGVNDSFTVPLILERMVNLHQIQSVSFEKVQDLNDLELQPIEK